MTALAPRLNLSEPTYRKSADIVSFHATIVPALVDDFARSCAKLIWATFPARSQNAVCIAAAHATGASPDTFERILSGSTKRIDASLILALLALHQARTGKPFTTNGGFEIRISQAVRN